MFFVKKMPVIKLQSSDGEIFEVEVDIAKASNTIKTMIEGNLQIYEHNNSLLLSPLLYQLEPFLLAELSTDRVS